MELPDFLKKKPVQVTLRISLIIAVVVLAIFAAVGVLTLAIHLFFIALILIAALYVVVFLIYFFVVLMVGAASTMKNGRTIALRNLLGFLLILIIFQSYRAKFGFPATRLSESEYFAPFFLCMFGLLFFYLSELYVIGVHTRHKARAEEKETFYFRIFGSSLLFLSRDLFVPMVLISIALHNIEGGGFEKILAFLNWAFFDFLQLLNSIPGTELKLGDEIARLFHEQIEKLGRWFEG